MSVATQARRHAQFVRHLDRHLLRRLFGFDVWHVNRLGDRPYALSVVAYLNGLPDTQRGRVVEIGCGLGDILRRLRFRERLGLDADRAVVRAARLLACLSLHGRARFAEFTFPHPLDGRHDAIIMVNWPHLVDEEQLRPQLAAYVREHLTPAGVLIIDTVQDRAYTFNHRIERLAPGGSSVVKLGDFARQRELWAIGWPNPQALPPHAR
jgi:SAM-dependent methyltransferase